MSYANLTISDKNPIKRWLQRRRFDDALKALDRAAPAPAPLKVMDYGAGNGELIRQLAELRPIEATVFEPTPTLMKEARQHLSHLDAVSFCRTPTEAPGIILTTYSVWRCLSTCLPNRPSRRLRRFNDY